MEREAKDRKEVEGKNGGIGWDADGPEMKCSADEWLKDLRNVWVDMVVKGRVYPEGLGLLPTQAPADSPSARDVAQSWWSEKLRC